MANNTKFEEIFENWEQQGCGVSIRGEGAKLDSREDVAFLITKINECKRLVYLELGGNSLGKEAGEVLGKALESKVELQALLWKDLFTGRLKNEIPITLRHLLDGVQAAGARITRLDLSDNALGPVAMDGLLPFFKSRAAFSIRELIVNNNGFGPTGGSMFAEALLQAVKDSESGSEEERFKLKIFCCGRNRLENVAAKKFAAFFEEVKTLEQVHMPQNGIYAEGIAALAKAFERNSSLEVINLNDNVVKGSGLNKFSQALKTLTKLKELNLGDCLLKTKGVLEICTAIRGHPNIAEINFESNEIKKTAVEVLISVFNSLKALNLVNMSGNNLGECAAERIQKSLNNAEVLVEDNEDSGGEDEEEDLEEDDECKDNTFDEDLNSTQVSYTSVSESDVTAGSFVNNVSNENNDSTDNIVQDFLSSFSESAFKKLGPNASVILIDYMKSLPMEYRAEMCVHTAIKFTLKCIKMFPDSSFFGDIMSYTLEIGDPKDIALSLFKYCGLISSDLSVYDITDWTLYAIAKFLKKEKVPIKFLSVILKAQMEHPPGVSELGIKILLNVTAQKFLSLSKAS